MNAGQNLQRRGKSLQRRVQNSGQSLQRREARCRRVCQWFRNVGTKIRDGIETMSNAINEFFVNVANGIVSLVRDGVEMFMSVIDGMVGFAQAIASGNIKLAFEELGKGFTQAFQIGWNRVKAIGKGIWKGLLVIKEAFVKLWKFLVTIKPSFWVTIIVSIAVGTAMTMIFPPLGVAMLGLTAGSFSATAVSMVITAGAVALDLFLVSRKIETSITNGMQEIDQEYMDNKKPETLTEPESNQELTLDKILNEYCYTEPSGEYICLIEAIGVFCLTSKPTFEQVSPYMCANETLKEFYYEDGVTSLYNYTTELYDPPFKKKYDKLFILGAERTYDKQRKEYCFVDTQKKCWSESLNADCVIVQGSPDECFDKENRQFYVENGVKSFYNETTGLYDPPLKTKYDKLFILGAERTYDKQRQEYCYVDEQNQRKCWSESLKAECVIVQGEDDHCFDDKGWFVVQDGVRSYDKEETVSTVTNEPQTTYDKQRQEYCYVDEQNGQRCLSESLNADCIIVQGEYDWCEDDTGWFKLTDGIKYYMIDGEWVAEWDLL